MLFFLWDSGDVDEIARNIDPMITFTVWFLRWL